MVSKRLYDNPAALNWNTALTTEAIFIVLNYAACIVVFGNIITFSKIHFRQLLQNRTSIESLQELNLAEHLKLQRFLGHDDCSIQETKFPYARPWHCPQRQVDFGSKLLAVVVAKSN
ncbi:hypothetical protein AX15_001922 [Amanita polypyramis BW_CC]|nr:hypothetical protein AX15_001922 [Amanita polypyramis BW_CC]